MGDSCCRIERQSNGFTVDIRDPEIEAANNKRDNSRSAPIGRWRDPWKSYVFKDVGEPGLGFGLIDRSDVQFRRGQESAH